MGPAKVVTTRNEGECVIHKVDILKIKFLLQLRGAGQVGRPGSPGLPGPKVGKVCMHAPLLAMHNNNYIITIWVIGIMEICN